MERFHLEERVVFVYDTLVIKSVFREERAFLCKRNGEIPVTVNVGNEEKEPDVRDNRENDV